MKSNHKLNKIKRKKVKNKILKNRPLMLTIFIVVIIVFSVTFIYSQLAGMDREILAQKETIEELEKTKMALAGDIKGIKSSAQIQDEAMYKLGMIYPNDSQIVYIDTNTEQTEKDVNYNVFLSPIVSVLRSFTKD
ncbi:MAG: septum formation initiator family protein [Tissierellia bacterium]|nr:septum formation initiator family protein [Tissierellia bacterium]